MSEQTREELEAENARLRRAVERLTKRVGEQSRELEELSEDNERLRKENAELRRAAKRQAHPFARRRRALRRRKPGRPLGHPPASPRVPDHVDASVAVPLHGCPCCGGPVSDVREHEQYVVDLPPVVPQVQHVVTQSGWCGRCRRRVRTTHPSQVSRAGGAASVALGPRALGMAAELKHRMGMPYRDIASLFAAYFGLRVTHGALVQASLRVARRGETTYEMLVGLARVSPVVHSDETGWKVDSQGAWLWVFATPLVTVYAVRFSRGHDVVLEMLGADFGGVLVSDGLPALDVLHKQHGFARAQCLGHPLRRAAALVEVQKRGAARFPHAAKKLLSDTIDLSRRFGELTTSTMAEYARRIERRADTLLAWQPTDPDNAKLAAHLRNHRDQLFRCLHDSRVAATNNLAEQQLRGAVIVRKIGGCNRSPRHAGAHAILASVGQTAHRHGITLADFVADWMHVQPLTRDPPPLLPTAAGLLVQAVRRSRCVSS